ncbi:MAG: 23S rRNA (adenine(2503)-C(2))-methyltransferase RlmN [Candidatus Bathyarchaeia archaeon]
MRLVQLKQPSLLGMTLEEMKTFFLEMGEKPFRAAQAYRAIYKHRILKFEQITEFSLALRSQLSCKATIERMQIDKVYHSIDGTRRYLFRLGDGLEIESVWIPEPDRATICISSQVGCPLACEFCLTGLIGVKRNLSAGEIVGQVLLVLADIFGHQPADRQINIVMMGMGEPLLNYENSLKAIRLLSDEAGVSISTRHITLSTAGIVPRIYDLGREQVRPKLAISLTGARDELRNRLMPINRKYPLAELLQACRDFPLKARERITFEYVMLDGVTDSDTDARLLVKLLSGIRAKVNLIPHNPAEELPFQPSSDKQILRFQQILTDHGLSAFIRRPRGRDIFAACGQLAVKALNEPALVHH